MKQQLRKTTMLPHLKNLESGKVIIYADGGITRAGVGTYGIILLHGEHRREIQGGLKNTTSNRMEILACLVGLETLKKPCDVTIFSDSQYVVNSIQQRWIWRWQQNNWKRWEDGSFVPVKNVDLWQRMVEQLHRHNSVLFRWIKGHSGVVENERCHTLAQEAKNMWWPNDESRGL